MKRYAVIGSNSFSGGHMVDRLLADPENQVIGISRSPEKSALFLPYKRHKNPPFRFFQLDLNTEAEAVMECLDAFRPEVVINFAAQGEVGSSWKYPHHWFETNAVGIVKLSDALQRRSYLKRYVQISTPEVYGTCEGAVREGAPLNPSTPYAASKAAGDLFLGTLVKQYGFPCLFIRSTNVYGRHQQLYRIIPRTILYLKMGKVIPLHGGGRAIKSYIHIRDVCEGVLAVALKGETGQTYHLAADHAVSVRDLVRRLCEKLGADFSKSAEPVAERPGQDARYFIDASKASETLGWRPAIGMDEGLDEMIGWIEENWAAIRKEPLDYIHQP